MGSAGGGASGAGAVAQLSAGILQAFGQKQSLEAQAGAADFNAGVAKENAAVANSNANIASQGAEQQTGIAEVKNKANLGALKTNTAASGESINSGSPVQVRQSASEVGNLDAYTVRANAIKEAYGYQVQAKNFQGEEALASTEAEQDKAAIPIAMASSILGGAGSAGSTYSNFLYQGGLNG